MRYEIILSPEVAQDLHALRAYDRTIVREALEKYLRHAPEKVSRSRIKRLRGLTKPQYRLRVGDFRIFYDISGDEVQVLAVVSKADADEWLKRIGLSDEESRSLRDQE